jgi:DNA-binding NtrC family response regulator
VLEMLCAYPWPGNVRELENCVQKAVVLAPGGVFLEELVPPTIRSYAEQPARAAVSAIQVEKPALDPEADLQASLERYADAASPDINLLMTKAERILISWTLNRERGVKLRAAKNLGINRVTLDRKLVEYDLHVKRGQGIVAMAEGVSV